LFYPVFTIYSLYLRHFPFNMYTWDYTVFLTSLPCVFQSRYRTFIRHVATSHVSTRNYYVIMPNADWGCGFESVGGMIARLLWVLSSRVVLLSVVHLSFISKTVWWGGLCPLELSRHDKKVPCYTVSDIKVGRMTQVCTVIFVFVIIASQRTMKNIVVYKINLGFSML